MFTNSNLVISAWKGEELIGISRFLTDFSWCCYLADLAVREDFQKARIGRKLVEITRETVGENSNILLLFVPEAIDYNPKIGMEKVENEFILEVISKIGFAPFAKAFAFFALLINPGENSSAKIRNGFRRVTQRAVFIFLR